MNKSEYTIVIISNRRPSEPYFTYDEFYKSLEGEEILNLCHYFPNVYRNLSDRPRMLYAAFMNGLIKTEKILFCDSFDLCFVDKPNIVFEKWADMKCDLAISAEKNCFPDDYREQFNAAAPSNTSYKYINCGTVLGYSEAFFEALKSMDASNHPYDYWIPEEQRNFHYNEQIHWQSEFFKQPVNIKMDYYQNIANCFQDVLPEELDFSGERFKNIECNTYPSIAHFNGNSKDRYGVRELVLKSMNL